MSIEYFKPAVSTAGTDTIQLLATSPIAAYDLVNIDGTVADSAVVAKRNKAVGIAIAAIAAGFFGTVQTFGEITNPAWTFTPGEIIYLNGTALSGTAPATGFNQIIGQAKSATILELNLKQATRY